MLYQDFKKNYERENFEDVYTVEDARESKSKPVEKIERSPKNKKSKKGVKKFFLGFFCVALISLSAFLLYVEVFVSGGIKGFFSGLKNDEGEYYYYVAASAVDYEEAKSLSDNLYSQGAAGYVYYDGEYKVLLSFYPKAEYAQIVADKTKYSVIKIPKNKDNTLNSKKKEARDGVNELILGLYAASAKSDEEERREKIEKLSVEFRSDVQDYLDGNDNDYAYKAKLEVIKRVMNNLSSSPSLPEIRYATIAISLMF